MDNLSKIIYYVNNFGASNHVAPRLKSGIALVATSVLLTAPCELLLPATLLSQDVRTFFSRHWQIIKMGKSFAPLASQRPSLLHTIKVQLRQISTKQLVCAGIALVGVAIGSYSSGSLSLLKKIIFSLQYNTTAFPLSRKIVAVARNVHPIARLAGLAILIPTGRYVVQIFFPFTQRNHVDPTNPPQPSTQKSKQDPYIPSVEVKSTSVEVEPTSMEVKSTSMEVKSTSVEVVTTHKVEASTEFPNRDSSENMVQSAQEMFTPQLYKQLLEVKPTSVAFTEELVAEPAISTEPLQIGIVDSSLTLVPISEETQKEIRQIIIHAGLSMWFFPISDYFSKKDNSCRALLSYHQGILAGVLLLKEHANDGGKHFKNSFKIERLAVVTQFQSTKKKKSNLHIGKDLVMAAAAIAKKKGKTLTLEYPLTRPSEEDNEGTENNARLNEDHDRRHAFYEKHIPMQYTQEDQRFTDGYPPETWTTRYLRYSP